MACGHLEWCDDCKVNPDRGDLRIKTLEEAAKCADLFAAIALEEADRGVVGARETAGSIAMLADEIRRLKDDEVPVE